MAFTITFSRGAYGSGGTVPTSITANSGETVRLPDYPGFTSSGSKMCGWSSVDEVNYRLFWARLNDGQAFEHNAEYIVTGNVTLYPLWGDDSVGPHFSSVKTTTTDGVERSDLGRVSWTKSYTASGTRSTVYLLFGPKEGYAYDSATVTCDGMTYELPYQGSDAFVGNKTTSNATIVARYKALTYDVVCSPGAYGSGTATTLTKNDGVALTLPGAIFTRTGYTQTGWATSDGGTLAYQLGGSYTTDAAATLYPVWTINQYTATFDANGGTGGTQKTQDYGTALTAPTVSKTGYTFAGWSPAVPSTMPAENKPYVAQWTANQYRVDFGKNGGTGGDDYVTATYGAAMPTPRTAPTKAGHGFGGYWDTVAVDSGGNPLGTQYYDANMGSAHVWDKASTATLWAKWTANSYTATFDANGGTGGTQKTQDYGTALTAPTVSKTGYTFAGWSPTVPSTMPAENKTYVAQWTANQYRVDFGKNGGTGGDDYVTATYGAAMPAATAPEKAGYTFDGYWNTVNTGGRQYYDGSMQSVRSWDQATDTTIWAKWIPNTYDVTFDATGGYSETTTAEVTYGSAYGTLPSPTRIGYTFVGWFTASSGGTQVTAATTVATAADHTLYAHWTKDEICVVLDPNGGNIAPSSLWVNVASGVYPALPTATGLTGWFTAATGGTQKTQGSALAQQTDHTLYAHRTVTHTLTLRDAANNYVSTRSVAEGSAYGTLPTPTRTGYTFAGWFTGTVSGTQVTAATTMGAADATIYARWTPTSLTITFNSNGGSAISPSSRTALYGHQFGTLPKPKKSGKKFDGWWTVASGGTKITASTIATVSLTVYAHWRNPASVVW